MVGERQQVQPGKHRFELACDAPRQTLRAEGDQRAGVAQDGMADIRIGWCRYWCASTVPTPNLRSSASILAGERRERLELVGVEEERPALILRQVGATEGS